MKTTPTQKRQACALLLCLLLAGSLGWPIAAHADTAEPEETTVLGKLAEGLRFDLRTLAYGLAQEPADSTQNPGNAFLRLPQTAETLEFRPDLAFAADTLDLLAKPRLHLAYRQWEDGERAGASVWDNHFYVNEWLARWSARENLFVSYGRENLQWGPSLLFSPSNPFFIDNGRRNPYVEVPGMDFGRVVWIPDGAWTISFIANTDAGRNDVNRPGPFAKAYAVKLDLQGGDGYGSLVVSRRENGETSLGFFGGRTVSDALLAYLEGALIRDVHALYPQADASPLGASLENGRLGGAAIDPVFLLGSAYTFAGGGTLTGEYVYYGPGYDSAEAGLYYALRGKAAAALPDGGPIAGLAQLTLGQTVNTGLRLLRKNYLLVQYNRTNIENCLDLTFRWTQNLDDGSGQFTALATYMLGDHSQLFTVGTLDAGSGETEFGSLLDYQWMLGIQYTF